MNSRDLLAGASILGTAALAARAQTQPSQAKVVDVHTHMYSHGWVRAVQKANDPTFRIGVRTSSVRR